MKRLFSISICVILSCICTFAQLKNWNNYTNTNMVICMQDEGEVLWIGTNGGLVRLNKQNGRKQFYNSCDGLPETKVSALAINKKGDLWTSTEKGIISKFNGTEFDILKATENTPYQSTTLNYALAVDEEDNLWYGALNRYSIIDKEAGTSILSGWELPEAALASGGGIFSYLFTTKNGEEVLYIGANIGKNYLLEFNGNELRTILKGQIPSAVTGLAQGENESFWMTTEKSGLIHYAKDGTLTIYNTENSNIPNNSINDIKADNEGRYWLASGCSLVMFDGKEFTTYHHNLIESMNGLNFITKIIVEEDGTVWVGTKRQGLFKFKKDEFSKVDISPNSLSDNQMGYSMCIDQEGNLWNAGRLDLLKIDKNNEWHSMFKLNNKEIPTSYRIQAVGSDRQGYVWVALSMSDTCVVKMSPKGEIIEAFTKFTHPTLAAGTQRESCFAFDLQGNVWWGTYAALYRYDGKTWEHFDSNNSPIPCDAITDLKIDSKGILWGTTGFLDGTGGILKWNGTTWTIYTDKNSDLPTNFVMCMDIDSQDRIWLHCRDKNGYVGKEYGGGLTCFDGIEWTSYTTYNSDITSNTIWDIAIDNLDRIWMGTAETGLTCLYDGTWINYNTDNSDIASNEVSCIQIDNYRNRIWTNHLYSNGISSAEFDDAEGVNLLHRTDKAKIHIVGYQLYSESLYALKLELFNTIGIKMDEALFLNGKASVTVDKVPATYLYIVTYPDGRRESGKVAVR